MSKKLVITEKPSVAKELAKVLGTNQKTKTYFEGDQYVITWAFGHLLSLQLPEDIKKEWQQWRLEDLPIIPKHIGLKPLPKTGGQLKAISHLANRKDISGAVIATDSGREGEAVARYILEWIKFDKPVERLWISSQTTKAIKAGFANLKPAKQFDNLYASALARGHADWLIGLNVTRALTTKYEDNLSAGRVQTPTLAFVNETAQQINRFKPQTYYTIHLTVDQQQAALQLANPQSIKTRQAADELVAQLQQAKGQVVSVKTTQKSQVAPLPYDLTELQQVANAKYGLSAKKTLSLIQALYEIHKVVSYPRTDSKYLSTDIEETLKERLSALVKFDPRAKQYLGQGSQVKQKAVFNDGKVTDHYALIPTEEPVRAEKLSTDELRMYRLIVERFLGLFADPYVTAVTKAAVKFGEQIFTFKQTKVVQQGWHATDKEGQLTATVDWQEGMAVRANFAVKEQLTTPPKPLTEGTLLGKMEHYGLGTPATRAEIIEKLVRSELLERQGHALAVTPKGQQLLQLVNQTLVSPELTGKWEQSLEAIAKGQENPKAFITEIEGATKTLVSEIKKSETKYRDFAVTNKKCPECDHPLKERNTRDGKFYVCTNCHYRRRKDPKVSNHRCPQCHKKMVIIEGQGGAYFRCLNDGTTEKMLDKKDRKKKISKHEERRLIQKVNQADEPAESPLAAALRKAMEK
ncbi:DNA topoisomerase III [Latilactobacillus graminis]|uniref:DNA topoisomerase n=2 Tax=Latilactobacillus graminis TaxID=60519 RepID=A0AA89I1W1_9LACO|nr:DNA topoisomerase III [Latilactobacillus graminis]KRM24048.1 DNA topoisomerase III family protein [Latilactobacillus graminis DSM 20719]QFP79790.1 DNA topoisomerase III [Latilactobacillus graminis]